jgi:hypothetical protein
MSNDNKDQMVESINIGGVSIDDTHDHQQHGKPSEFMCCLVSMEDINEENNNYGVYLCISWLP